MPTRSGSASTSNPTGDGGLTPAQLGALTPEQLVAYTRQLQPENNWSVHPLIDGCSPRQEPPPIK